jgi:hypothetical protein
LGVRGFGLQTGLDPFFPKEKYHLSTETGEVHHDGAHVAAPAMANVIESTCNCLKSFVDINERGEGRSA